MDRSDVTLRIELYIVTGAASGIGAATARLFAVHGAMVYCADVDGPGCFSVAAQIHRTAPDDYALRFDVTSDDQWETAVRRIVTVAGGLDVLVNAAGISHSAALIDLPLVEWRRVFAVNLDSIFLGTQRAIRAMSARGGCVVNVSSAAGIRASAGASAYSTSRRRLACSRAWRQRSASNVGGRSGLMLWRLRGFEPLYGERCHFFKRS